MRDEIDTLDEELVAEPQPTRRPRGRLTERMMDGLDDGMRATRRVVRQSSRKAEDLAYDAAGEIRKRPFGAIGAAFLAGAAVGGIGMLLVAKPRKPRKHR